MATQAPSDSFSVSAQDVGNIFVDKYYHLLHRSPELVHKFYDDKSLLSRPGPNSEMTSVTTIQGINEKVMSFDYNDSTTEIISVDAQESLMEGVIVAVTGCWTGKDNVRRQFTQMFFLAKQDKGYYVLNDVFRFVDVHKQSFPLAVLDIDENIPTAPSTKDPEPGLVPNHTSTPIKVDSDNGVKVSDLSDVQGSGVEQGSVPKTSVNSSQNDVLPVALSGSNNHKDAPLKLSYASMVAKKSIASSPLHAPACVIVRVAPSSDQQPPASAAPKARAASVAPKARAASVAPKARAASAAPKARTASAAPKASDPRGAGAPQSSCAHAEVKSIYVGNLPEDITKNQLIGIFQKFGTIKEDGVQLRNPEEDGFRFAFVEFVSSNSARMAVEVRKIAFGEKKAFIDYKRTYTQVRNNRGRFASGRDGFRNDSFRGWKNFGESPSNGRHEYGSQSNFSEKAQGAFERNGEAHQRVYQNGDGRLARQGEPRSRILHD